MHRNSEMLFRKHALRLFNHGMKVLEIGPEGAESLFRRMVAAFGIDLTWDTTDITDVPGLTFCMDEYRIPAPPNHYALVLSAQVIEHVRKPWLWMPELARVCKPTGHVVTICPVSWPYHEHPVDCWRMYPEAMRALHEEAGLRTVVAVSETLDTDSGVLDTIAVGQKEYVL